MLAEAPIRLLIIDDQPSIRQLIALVGSGAGLQCLEARSGGEAMRRLEETSPELLLTDLNLEETSGLELLAGAKRRLPFCEAALMCSLGDTERALEAMRLGAYDCILKPIQVEKLRLLLLRMAEKIRLRREIEFLRSRLDGLPYPALCTDLAELERITMQQVLAQVEGDKEQARRLLGISRATLYRKIKRYGLPAGVARG